MRNYTKQLTSPRRRRGLGWILTELIQDSAGMYQGTRLRQPGSFVPQDDG